MGVHVCVIYYSELKGSVRIKGVAHKSFHVNRPISIEAYPPCFFLTYLVVVSCIEQEKGSVTNENHLLKKGVGDK